MTDIEYLKKYYKGNLNDAIKRLENNEPVQYIVGEVDFYGNIIKVNKNVLIPRFETEELVDYTIKFIKDKFNKKINILDIGTGSGAIAISLKKEIDSNVYATDISKDALIVAKENAINNNVNINFINTNIYEGINQKFDVIISNPPYISYDEEIMDIVKNNEPNIALYADNNGLYFYEEILKNIKSIINDKYLIAFEIGMTQFEDIKKYKELYLKDSIITLKKDMQGRNRMVFITNIE
ncbi:MAG: peptide chain release factor N(5)-glutamine methyltransferase [Bacilli bacterium]|nr:peptide chain release factor N(5)-glutamine methyltransferase [Bacilli bacterium]